MQNTKINIKENGRLRPYNGTVNIRLVPYGRWRYDGVIGKTLCLIEIEVPTKNLRLTFTPSDVLQDELINNWMEAEHRNDNFLFENSDMGLTRPTCLPRKLNRIRNLLERWTRRIITQEVV
ncbi:MAG: hypothetical protein ACWGQW_00455 [bacterium]